MKIEVDKIDEITIRIEEDARASSWEMDSQDVTFIDPIHIACRAKRIEDEILIEADVDFTRDITCSRCLEEKRQKLTQKFIKSYNRRSLGQYLDIDNDIREEILLDFPMKVLCKPDCRGICTGCGVNLNLDKCKC